MSQTIDLSFSLSPLSLPLSSSLCARQGTRAPGSLRRCTAALTALLPPCCSLLSLPSLPHSSAHAARHGTRSPSSPLRAAAPLLLRRPATPPSTFPRRELRGRLTAPAHALTALSLASMPHRHARYKPRRAPFSLPPASSSPRHGRAAAKPRRRARPPRRAPCPSQPRPSPTTQAHSPLPTPPP